MKRAISLSVFVIVMIVLTIVGYHITMNYFVPWLLEQDGYVYPFVLIGALMLGIILFVWIGEAIGKFFGIDEVVNKYIK